MFDSFSKNTLVPLVLRAGLAVIFIYHGSHKIFPEGSSLGASWHTPADAEPALVQLLVAWGELIGGLAMVAGFLTRFASLGLSIIMMGAILKVHGRNGFNLHGKEGLGYEYNFAIIVLCAALILLGSGTLGVDKWFRLRRKPTNTKF